MFVIIVRKYNAFIPRGQTNGKKSVWTVIFLPENLVGMPKVHIFAATMLVCNVTIFVLTSYQRLVK